MSQIPRTFGSDPLQVARSAYAPGRVNLIGDHTDYNDGLALPMAIELGTTVRFEPDDTPRIFLCSSVEPEPAEVSLDLEADADKVRRIEPRWARYVAALVAESAPRSGGGGTVETTLPVGAGLSSSASFEVALALAIGASGDPLSVAQLCQRAEKLATGVAAGIMDQLVACAATEGSALLIDFAELTWRPVLLPEGLEIFVVDSGQRRTLDRSLYAARRAECEQASAVLSTPLGCAEECDLDEITDAVLRRRARHVVTECERVRRFVSAIAQPDVAEAGRLMSESHSSLSSDFEVSTDEMDDLARRLIDTNGILGARMTGAGFGGCLVAIAESGAVRADELSSTLGHPARRVHPSAAAHVELG